jgi:anaerobic C4-dicarboxylate transporter
MFIPCLTVLFLISMFSWSNSLNDDPADLDKLKVIEMKFNVIQIRKSIEVSISSYLFIYLFFLEKVTIVNTLAIHQSHENYKTRGEDNWKPYKRAREHFINH